MPKLLRLHFSCDSAFPVGGLVPVFASASVPSTRFTRLRRLSIDARTIAMESSSQSIDPRFLGSLALLSDLYMLRLVDWQQHVCMIDDSSRHELNIRTLELDQYADSPPSAAAPTFMLLALCPHLRDLDISCTAVDSISLRNVLPTIKAPLKSLAIFGDLFTEALDPLLVNLTSLRRLSLFNLRVLSSRPHLYLSRLTLLSNLVLCIDDSPSEAIDSLLLLIVDGPYQLRHLKRLELECDWTHDGLGVGKRFKPVIDSENSNDPDMSGQDYGEWGMVPSDGYPPSRYRAAKSIIRAASSRSIDLDGKVFEGVRAFDQLLLEAHNLTVGEAYYREDFGDIHGNRERAVDYGFEEPEIEIVEEEREDWELVKNIVLFENSGGVREERWFALSLVNKNNGRIIGEWKGNGLCNEEE